MHTGRVQNLHGVPRPGLRKEELRGRAEAVASQSLGND
jgi:hypothetical protein